MNDSKICQSLDDRYYFFILDKCIDVKDGIVEPEEAAAEVQALLFNFMTIRSA